MRSIVFLILIIPLVSFSQSFNKDKNIFINDDLNLSKIGGGIKIFVGQLIKDSRCIQLSKEAWYPHIKGEKREYKIYDCSGSLIWNKNAGPSYWKIIKKSSFYTLRISINNYIFYEFDLKPQNEDSRRLDGFSDNTGAIAGDIRKDYHSMKGSVSMRKTNLYIDDDGKSQKDIISYFSYTDNSSKNYINNYIKSYVEK
jgi:hypothetical protein